MEGALKLMEMSQIMTQAFHPLEYRHGPISLVDEQTAAIMLYSSDQKEAEIKLVEELRDKGAVVIGFGGPGDIEFAVDAGLSLGRSCRASGAADPWGARSPRPEASRRSPPGTWTKVVTLA